MQTSHPTPRQPPSSAVVVRDLKIDLVSTGKDIVDAIAIDVRAGEVLGLVGESGSGKTTVGMALMGYCRPGGKVTGGEILIDGRPLAAMAAGELRRLRGGTVSYIPQDPGTALNPALRIGRQLSEMLEAHKAQTSADERKARIREALEEVALPTDEEFLRRYPHQLSGGQQQRVAIAMAFACRPHVIVCDEPTTGLDVTTQARVLETVRDLCHSHHVAAVYVSHDLAVVAELADTVAVMYAGRIVERGPRDAIFAKPRHPYTRKLLRAVPDMEGKRAVVGIAGHAPLPGNRPTGCFFAPRCDLAIDRCQRGVPAAHGVRGRASRALLPRRRGADRAAHDRGDAGGGAGRRRRALGGAPQRPLRLGPCPARHRPRGPPQRVRGRGGRVGQRQDDAGALHLRAARPLHGRRQARRRAPGRERPPAQHPGPQADPVRVPEPLRVAEPAAHGGPDDRAPAAAVRRGSGATPAQRVAECLERVALSSAAANRYPDQLSGGERQRVAIARALAAEPSLLVCDEVTSALDVSVQAAIVELLRDLRAETGLSMLFITHNLALIRTIADRVIVMTEGTIVESGETISVFESPSAEYTSKLLANTPTVEAALSR